MTMRMIAHIGKPLLALGAPPDAPAVASAFLAAELAAELAVFAALETVDAAVRVRRAAPQPQPLDRQGQRAAQRRRALARVRRKRRGNGVLLTVEQERMAEGSDQFDGSC